jgi:hypothetical protein
MRVYSDAGEPATAGDAITAFDSHESRGMNASRMFVMMPDRLAVTFSRMVLSKAGTPSVRPGGCGVAPGGHLACVTR